LTIVLLLTVILASYVCVRVGAVAFELTGIPWDQAKFQALSAFSNCGFTTRESEDVLRHPLRRRIATYLIISGNAGVVTTIATFASALVGADLHRALVNLLSVTLCVAVIAWLAKRPILAQRVRLAVQRWLSARVDFQPSVEALLHVDQGFRLVRASLAAGSPAIGQSLAAIRPREHKLQVLAIERDRQFIPLPDEADVLVAGDTVVVYGTDQAVAAVFGAATRRHLGVVTLLEETADGAANDRTQSPAGSQLLKGPQ
jgi:hypothetical protein